MVDKFFFFSLQFCNKCSSVIFLLPVTELEHESEIASELEMEYHYNQLILKTAL